jgi:hypothetical protein
MTRQQLASTAVGVTASITPFIWIFGIDVPAEEIVPTLLGIGLLFSPYALLAYRAPTVRWVVWAAAVVVIVLGAGWVLASGGLALVWALPLQLLVAYAAGSARFERRGLSGSDAGTVGADDS